MMPLAFAAAMWLGILPCGATLPWSASATWQGALPKAGDVVTIEEGTTVLLDLTPPELGGLIVKGNLIFDRRDISLSTGWILVDGGTLTIGSPRNVHTNEAIITLTGTEENDNVTDEGLRRMGKKFIGVMNGGSLDLHGSRAESRNWTQLQGHAFAGSTSLRVADTVDWKVGDHLVIAPSGFNPTEAEEVSVISVSDGVIHFTPPLRYDHWGEFQIIEGHTIDERAEVACLTRNIVIQGDEASEKLDFGGHLMFGPGTTVRIAGVEFYRMGQKGHAARYPIHWHLAGNRQGDYARGNSIHHSYHRGIVVHGSSNILVEGNVCYDIWSHTFVPSEDGSERGNRFIGNLGILTRRLALADYTFPESAAGASFQSEGRPGVYWMKSPDQVLIGNHAAGVVNGMGFFYDGASSRKEWSGQFTNNTAHACLGPAGSGADRYPGQTVGYGLFMEDQGAPEEINFQNFTAYKNTLSGIWLEAPGQRAINATLADNGTGAILSQSSIEDSVIIGQSANTVGTLPQIGVSLSGGVHIISYSGLKAPQLRNIDFIDQRDAGIVMLGSRLHPLSVLENLSFENTQPCWIAEPDQLVGGFTDTDGSLREDGIPAFIHGKEPLAVTEETTFDATINAWVTPLASLQYLSLIDTNPVSEDIGFTVLVRDEQNGTLPDTSRSGQSATLSGYLAHNTVYEMLRFDPLPEGVQIAIESELPGFIILEVDSPESAYVYDGVTSAFGSSVPDFERLSPKGDSVAGVREGLSTSWYQDTATQTLHQRLESNRAVFLFKQPTGGLDVSNPERLWQSQQFGYQLVKIESEERIWGAIEDPDGDGHENRFEYFLNTNPLQADNPIEFDPLRRQLTFSRNLKATDLDFIVSYSTDLRTWQSNTVIQSSVLPNEAQQIYATAPDLPSNQSLFMKLQVHLVH
ncbi:MAG: hypothetical protein ACI9R3_003027 [Verrucomicrobiales bacterium]|jgi:hypothetical protein